MSTYLSPSIMCGDWLHFEKTIQQFEENDIEYIHIDIMDGEFVPNYTLGTDIVRILHKRTHIPLDIHLMVTNPELKVTYFEVLPQDILTFHIEATKNPQKVIDTILAKGCKVGIAISPDTPVSKIEPYLSQLDTITIMTVYPGFAGQKLVTHTLAKIQEVSKLIQNQNLDVLVEVDGNVSFENAVKMKQKGANIFVTGSSSLFHKDHTFEENTKKFRKLIK